MPIDELAGVPSFERAHLLDMLLKRQHARAEAWLISRGFTKNEARRAMFTMEALVVDQVYESKADHLVTFCLAVAGAGIGVLVLMALYQSISSGPEEATSGMGSLAGLMGKLIVAAVLCAVMALRKLHRNVRVKRVIRQVLEDSGPTAVNHPPR